jgi:hypothetical protein
MSSFRNRTIDAKTVISFTATDATIKLRQETAQRQFSGGKRHSAKSFTGNIQVFLSISYRHLRQTFSVVLLRNKPHAGGVSEIDQFFNNDNSLHASALRDG